MLKHVTVYLIFWIDLVIYCQDSNIVLSYVSRNTDGTIKINFLIGNPYEYVPDMAINEFIDYRYIIKTYPESANYQSISYSFKIDILAASYIEYRKIVILSGAAFGIGSLKEIDFIPISNGVTALALLPNFNLLYWIDKTFQYIGVIELSKFYWTRIVESNLSTPVSLAVDELNRFMFWIDISMKPKIERSNLFGQERTVISNYALNQPASLVIDKKRNRLCWLDTDLFCSEFNGKNQIAYKLDGDSNILQFFVIYEDIILFGTKTNLFPTYTFDDYGKLKKYSSFRYSAYTGTIAGSLDSSISNYPIENYENQCSHLYFPVGQTDHICGCKFGYILSSDGKTCTLALLKENTILVADSAQNVLYQLDPISGIAEVLLDFDENHVEKITYIDFSNQTFIYYILKDKRDIMLYDIKTGTQSLYHQSNTDITDLSADQKSNILIYSDINGKMFLINASKSYQILEINDERISRIYFDNQRRHLFYSECNTNNIVEIDLYSKKEINRFSVGVCASSIYTDSNKIYFSDGTKLCKCNLFNPTSVELMFTAKENIFEIAVANNILYFVENSNYVTKLDVLTSTSSYFTRPIFTKANLILMLKETRLNNVSSHPSNSLIIGVSLGSGSILIAIATLVIVIVLKRKKLKPKEPNNNVSEAKPTNETDCTSDNIYDEITREVELNTVSDDHVVYLNSSPSPIVYSSRREDQPQIELSSSPENQEGVTRNEDVDTGKDSGVYVNTGITSRSNQSSDV